MKLIEKYIDLQRLSRNGRLFLFVFLIGCGIFFLIRFLSLSLSNIKDKEIANILGIATVVAITFLILFFIKRISSFFIKAAKSDGWDIFPPIVASITLLFLIEQGKITNGVYFYFNTISTYSALPVVLSFIILSLFFLLANLNTKEKESPKSLFLSDNPEDTIDYLDLKEDAEKFAEKMLNNWSSESIVFGIDAPWGGGKTTYLNYCLEYLKKKYKEKIIIFNFKPLTFENQESLFRNFIVGLVTEINEKLYVPEVSSNLIKYGKVIENIKIKTPFIETTFDTSSAAEKIYEKLRDELKKIRRKIIISIDDLDRVQLNDLKLILIMVKISFDLPNLTFVLCYDTENINTFELPFKKSFWEIESDIDKNYKNTSKRSPFWFSENSTDLMSAKALIRSREELDNIKISEYLEKIINVKKTLIIGRTKLEEYFLNQLGELKNKIEYEGKKIDSKSFDEFKNEAKDNLSSENFSSFQPYLGDIRKIKRLINTIKLNNLFTKEEEFGKMDFIFSDLVNLLLIYINYPRIFRKIYAAETDEAHGFFSINRDYSSDRITYRNSDDYRLYIKDLNENEKFLLKELFSEKRFDEKSNKGIDLRLSAAHNNKYNHEIGNLEKYLRYIAHGEKPEAPGEMKFHLRKIEEIKDSKNKTIDDIFKENDFDFKKGENPRGLFFNVLLANLDRINFSIANSIIEHLLDNIKDYSLVDAANVYEGLRMSVPYYIIELLDKKGWEDGENQNVNNSDEHISKIARRIFSEEEYKNNGILEKLSDKEKGILGIYDMLVFRLHCSQDRSGHFFNVYRALAYHADKNAPKGGVVSELVINQMREISQKCFMIFEERYLDKEINIFTECKNLSDEEILGKFINATRRKFNKSGVPLRDELDKIRNTVTSFTIYQIGNSDINLGIGCGYYDSKGKQDKHGIQEKLQEYLINVCFNIEEKQGGKLENGKYFIDYLLANLKRARSNRNFSFVPDISAFSKTLGEDRLTKYWEKNRDKIKEYFKKDADLKTRVVTYNYIANYTEDLKTLFNELDKLIEIENTT